MIDPAYEDMLKRYQSAWEQGHFDALIPAVKLCAKVGLPLPAWLSEAALGDLQFAYRHRQRGGPSSRTGAIQDASNRRHSIRHLLVKTELEHQAWDIEKGMRKRLSKRDAAAVAYEVMRASGSPALGSIDAILESYALLESGGGKFEN